MSDSKRHHYIPAFHLRGFSHNGKLCRIEKKSAISIVSSVNNCAVFGKLYYTDIEDIEKIIGIYGMEYNFHNNSLEEAFSYIETKASLVHRKILNKNTLSDEERYLYAHYIATLYIRNPCQMKALSLKMIKIYFNSLIRFMKEKFKNRELLIEETIEKHAYKIILNRSYGLLWGLIPPIREIIFKLNWHYLESFNYKNFVISDNPVLLPILWPEKCKIVMYDFMKENDIFSIFPVSSRLSIVLTWKDGWNSSSLESVIAVSNAMQIMNADKEVYARFIDDSLKHLFRKYGNYDCVISIFTKKMEITIV